MAKRAGKRQSRTAPAKAPAESGSSLGGISTAELAREMARRQQAVGKLRRKRDALAAQVSEIDAELSRLGSVGASGTTRGGRPRNGMKLADALLEVLKGRTMSVTEAAQAVQLAGYQTSSDNFRTIVNQTLLKDERFENVERGRYRAKA